VISQAKHSFRAAIANNAKVLNRTVADGKRFVVPAEEQLTAFLELESAICTCGELI